MSDSLRPVVTMWSQLISAAHEHKRREFQTDADECYRFFDGPYDFLYQGMLRPRALTFGLGDEFDLPSVPTAQMTVNKVAELVQLFGPALYHRNPYRTVNPRKVLTPPPELFGDVDADPNAGMLFQQATQAALQDTVIDSVRAEVVQRYLNWTPTALDLKTHFLDGVNEALIKGMGVWWTRPFKPAGGTLTYAGSFWDSVDNLYMDPDATDSRDVKWVARRRVRPVWEAAREFGLPEEKLKGMASMETAEAQASVVAEVSGDWKRRQGRTADLMVYWEVYSKMGMGGRLMGMTPGRRPLLDAAGDYCYLAICDTCPYPLNLPPPYCDVFDPEKAMAVAPEAFAEAQRRLAWQTPFWADDAWPFETLVFHRRPGKLWPMSHMKPGLGELTFLNWAWSMLATKLKVAFRDFIAIAKAASDDLKEKIKHGQDYTVIEVEAMFGDIDRVVKFLQHPGFNPEIFRVIDGVTLNFERRVGLTELVYGLSSRQMRSASEANLKSDAVNVRPDDMANKAEDAAAHLARKEAFCARWHLRGPDVRPVLGSVGEQLWEQLVVPTDPSLILNNLEYRIEAGSARKPNKATEVENMQNSMNNLFSPLLTYAQTTGDVDPLNALITDWAKANDFDASRYLFNPPPPPPPPVMPAGAPVDGGGAVPSEAA